MPHNETEVINTYIIIEQRHEISNNVVCATSKASDQPAYMRSLIRAFACRLNTLFVYLFIYLSIYTIFQEGDIFSSTASLPYGPLNI